MIGLSYVFYGWVGWRYCLLLLDDDGRRLRRRRRGHGARGTERRRRVAMGVSVAALLGLLGWFKYYGFVSVNLDNLTHAVGLGRAVPLLQVGPARRHLVLHLHGHQLRRRHLPAPARAGHGRSTSRSTSRSSPTWWPDRSCAASELLPQIRAAPRPRHDRLLARLLADHGRAVQEGRHLLVRVERHRRRRSSRRPRSTRRSRRSSRPGATPSRSTATSAATPTSPSASRCCSGFRFPQNFDAPYTARNLQDFWRRWHMTLSRWLRDYLYIPLGGSAGGRGAGPCATS